MAKEERRSAAGMAREPQTRIDPKTATKALRSLREEAADPISLYQKGEAGRTSWTSRVLSVLKGALGPESDTARKMGDIRYGLIAFTLDTPDSAWVRAFASGVEEACGYIDAAIFELSLLNQSAESGDTDTAAAIAASDRAATDGPDKRAVFVVHGRNLAARDAMFAYLRALGLLPIEWSQAVAATGKPSPYVGEILQAAFSRAQAILVLMTPDDEARLRPHLQGTGEPQHETDLTPQARANVIFEAGMAMAWDESRTVLVELGRCRPFSDLGGRHVLRLDDSSERRQELAQRLTSAGLGVEMTGTEWHHAGSFEASVS